jgi:flagellar motor switch protein FliN/FliY
MSNEEKDDFEENAQDIQSDQEPSSSHSSSLDMNHSDIGPTSENLAAIYDVPVSVSAVLGKATMQVSQLLKLGRGAVIELDRKVGEAIDVYVNNRLVARGEVVIVEEHLGITMTEIIKSDK